MIFEYMIHGDLAELLRRNDPVMRKNENDFKLQKVFQKFRYPYLNSKSKVCCQFKNYDIITLIPLPRKCA